MKAFRSEDVVAGAELFLHNLQQTGASRATGIPFPTSRVFTNPVLPEFGKAAPRRFSLLSGVEAFCGLLLWMTMQWWFRALVWTIVVGGLLAFAFVRVCVFLASPLTH
jgi:hypothetical protein